VKLPDLVVEWTQPEAATIEKTKAA